MGDYIQLIELLKLKGFEQIGVSLFKRGNTHVSIFKDGGLIFRTKHIDTVEWKKEEVNELSNFVSSKIYIENFL